MTNTTGMFRKGAFPLWRFRGTERIRSVKKKARFE